MSRIVRSAWLSLVAVGLVVGAAGAGSGTTVGKNPGQIKGRWLRVEDVAALRGYQGVYLGELSSDIQWKKKANEAPIDEDLLDEKLHAELMENLRLTSFFGKTLEEAPSKGKEGYVRLDCTLVVEPGSRAARWAVGFGGGKSRSVLEIKIVDHKSGKELGLYHGYGVGSGMGFKLAGGSARKMTEDDIEENARKFVALLGEL